MQGKPRRNWSELVDCAQPAHTFSKPSKGKERCACVWRLSLRPNACSLLPLPVVCHAEGGGLASYALAIHCGGCMIDQQKIRARLLDLKVGALPALRLSCPCPAPAACAAGAGGISAAFPSCPRRRRLSIQGTQLLHAAVGVLA